LYFIHDEVGYNYRMLNIQAALGVSQIRELESFIETKINNLEAYKRCLDGVEGLEIMPYREGIRPNHWFYCLYVDKDKFGESRDELMHRLISEGIQCRPVWRLNHMQKAYTDCQTYEIEKSIDYLENVLNVPCSSNLTAEDVEYVCDVIKLK